MEAKIRNTLIYSPKIEKRRILKFKENKTDVIESDWEKWRILQQNKHFLIWTFNEQKLLIPN